MTLQSWTHLSDLVNSELDLGFSLLQSANLAESEERRLRALRHALVSYESAQLFIEKIPPANVDPLWTLRLAELRLILKATSNEPQSQIDAAH